MLGLTRTRAGFGIARAIFGTALVAIAGAGCTLDPIGGNPYGAPSASAVPVASGDDAYAPSCGSPPPTLSGQGGPGAPCGSAADCAPACCDCGSGATSWEAASCVEGACAGPDVSCGRTSGAFCGAGAVPPPVPPLADDTCGGFAAPDTVAGACIRQTCCADGDACAADPTCSALVACRANCTDDACAAECDAQYGSSALADALTSCAASCGGA